MPGQEYILQVWKEKPINLLSPSNQYWSAHVTNAHRIPCIGECLDSSSGFDDYNRFRVFDVRHNIGGGLAELVTEGKGTLKHTSTPERGQGLLLVLAYLEQVHG
ncbi:MAG TPA: hypothetical protein VJA23_03040 [Candidatus Nanoarchaeia archaeon]|nr:hypothetical protein [Candidatus Nanoarchaeia archaeon]